MNNKPRWRHYCILVERDAPDHIVAVFSDLFTCPETIEFLGKTYEFINKRNLGGYGIYVERR